MYAKFEELLVKNDVTAYRVSKETGISTATLTDWKKGRSTPKADKLQKIADYFGVTVDYFTGNNSESGMELNKKDERDIAKKLQETLDQLTSSQTALMFDGVALDENTKELLKASLENSIRIAKINAKQKYTPNKYK